MESKLVKIHLGDNCVFIQDVDTCKSFKMNKEDFELLFEFNPTDEESPFFMGVAWELQ